MNRSRARVAAVALTASLALLGCAERETRAPIVTRPLLDGARIDTLVGEYSGVISAAEFHDSLLVVADHLEQTLWRLNLRRGLRDSIGRRGNGPGEYRRVGRIAKLHRDSVAMFDGFAGWPFVVIDVASGRGRTARVLDPGRRDQLEATLWVTATPYLQTADTLGRIFGAPEMAQPTIDTATRLPMPAEPLDTWTIVRFGIDGSTADTLVEFPRGHTYARSGRDAAGRSIRRLDPGRYAPLNGWTARDDGALLRADAGQYVLTLHAPDGDSLRSWRVPYAPITLSDSSWQAHLASARAFARQLMGGQIRDISDALGRPMRAPPEPTYEEPPKPATVPPLSLASGSASLYYVGENAWVPVHLDDSGTSLGWDVIDLETGTRRVRYTIPPRHRLLLVTRRGVYVVTTDAEDLQRILFVRPNP